MHIVHIVSVTYLLACFIIIIIIMVLSSNQHKATVIASLQLMHLSFSHPTSTLCNSKCTCGHLCAHGSVGVKMRCGQVHCYLEAAEKDCIIDQPGLKLMEQDFHAI